MGCTAWALFSCFLNFFFYCFFNMMYSNDMLAEHPQTSFTLNITQLSNSVMHVVNTRINDTQNSHLHFIDDFFFQSWR